MPRYFFYRNMIKMVDSKKIIYQNLILLELLTRSKLPIVKVILSVNIQFYYINYMNFLFLHQKLSCRVENWEHNLKSSFFILQDAKRYLQKNLHVKLYLTQLFLQGVPTNLTYFGGQFTSFTSFGWVVPRLLIWLSRNYGFKTSLLIEKWVDLMGRILTDS